MLYTYENVNLVQAYSSICLDGVLVQLVALFVYRNYCLVDYFLLFLAVLVSMTKYYKMVTTCIFCHRLRDVGIPVGLVNAVTGFYDTYMARLRIGTKLTASYLVSSGLLEGTLG
jgi:hypothetical protein